MWVALGLVAVVVFAAAGLAYFMDGGSADSQQAEALSNPRAWRNRPRSRAMSQSVPEQIRRSAPPPHATAVASASMGGQYLSTPTYDAILRRLKASRSPVYPALHLWTLRSQS